MFKTSMHFCAKYSRHSLVMYVVPKYWTQTKQSSESHTRAVKKVLSLVEWSQTFLAMLFVTQ